MPLTAQQSLQSAIDLYAGANLNPKDFQNPAWLAKAQDQISNAQFDLNWYSPSCVSGQAPPLSAVPSEAGLALVTGVTGLNVAAKTGLLAAKAVPIVGSVVAGVELLVGFISAIFTHHAQAVKRDLAFGCAALPAVNNSLSVMAQLLQSGQTTPAAASMALDQIYISFMQQGGAVSPTDIPNGGTAINKSPFCNGNCEISIIVKAMVLYWQSQLNAVPVSSSAPAGPVSYSGTSSTAVLTAAVPLVAGSPTLAQTIAPSPGYGPLIAAVAVIALLVAVRTRRQVR